MALKNNYNDESIGLELTGVYSKIESVSIENRPTLRRVSIDVSTYISKDDRSNLKAPIKRQSYQIEESSGTPGEVTEHFSEDLLREEGASPLKLAYCYLKKLEAYADATDV